MTTTTTVTVTTTTITTTTITPTTIVTTTIMAFYYCTSNPQSAKKFIFKKLVKN